MSPIANAVIILTVLNECLDDHPNCGSIKPEESRNLGWAVLDLSEICTRVEGYGNDRLAYNLRNSPFQ